MGEVWDAPDAYNIYLPFWAWHNRLAYPPEQIERFNEFAWGAGAGKSKHYGDEERQLLTIWFQDSWNDWMGAVGYAWLRHKPLGNAGWHYSYGYAATFMFRNKQFNYIPVPVPVPLGGLGYKNVKLEATYIPGWHGYGHLLFMWLRVAV